MGSSKNNVVTISSREAILKRKLRRHLHNLGFSKSPDGRLITDGTGKDVVRTLHSHQRQERLNSSKEFIATHAENLLKYFAEGKDIDPTKISPVLQRIYSSTWESDLFKFASLSWSVPVSSGFGRRLRYLVWDEHNNKLIGLIAIGDPVYNMSVRDNLVGWSGEDRSKRLVNIMDAYVLGALPPYNSLLGGKMVACLLRSRDIYNEFTRTYGQSTGIISQEKKKARLLAITTSSSMGRSSVYNRLKLGGEQYFKAIGYTGGWGHFHVPDKLFDELRNHLRDIEHPYADLYNYGQGPNWRLRTVKAAIRSLGFKEDLMRHGIQREVFLCLLATNAVKILKTGKGKPDLSTLLSTHEVAQLALERWVIPRSQRRVEYKSWTHYDLINLYGKQKRKLQKMLKMKVV